MGHVTRCLALAQEVERHGMEPWFASRSTGGHLKMLEASGYPIVQMHRDAATELKAIGAHSVRDPGRRPFSAVVMDHYGLGVDWLGGARRLATRRLVIDDLADRRLPCELLVNATLGVEAFDYARLTPPATRLLLGPRFALLRPVFRTPQGDARRPASAAASVLVAMGGSDPSDATAMAVEATRAALPGARIDVVVGVFYNGRTVEAPGIHVHRAIQEEPLAQLMTEADLAIGAGGTMSWERCALGLPTLIVWLARNQERVARALGESGAAIDVGPMEGLDVAALTAHVSRLASDGSGRDTMSQKGRSLVDGRGAERVANHLDGVRVRRARMADARMLWKWANDPATRAASFTSEPIRYPDHAAWLSERLGDPSCLLLIGENGAGPLGQVRFDGRGSEAEVSISVAPEHRGTAGSLLLEAATHRSRRWLKSATLVARVKVGNQPSQLMFERAGYRLEGEGHGTLTYAAAPQIRP